MNIMFLPKKWRGFRMKGICIHIHSFFPDWQRLLWVSKHINWVSMCSFILLVPFIQRPFLLFFSPSRVSPFNSYFYRVHSLILSFFACLWNIKLKDKQWIDLLTRHSEVWVLCGELFISVCSHKYTVFLFEIACSFQHFWETDVFIKTNHNCSYIFV